MDIKNKNEVFKNYICKLKKYTYTQNIFLLLIFLEMKKILFSLLWIWCLLFQFSGAQANDLKEFLDDSEKTLQSEFSWSSDIVTPDNDFYDEDDYYDIEETPVYRERHHHGIQDDLDFSDDDIARFIGFWIGFIGIFFLCRLLWFIFWIRMVVDAAKYQKKDRVGWILVLLFFNFLWALIYLFAAKIGRKKEDTLQD